MSEQWEELMQQATQARREDRFADARRGFTRSVDICRQNGNKADLARALKGLGQIERDLGNLGIALQHYEEALALHRAEGDALKTAHTVRHVGDIHQDAGKLESAEPCYNEALQLYRVHKQTDALDLANTIRGMALLKEKTGNRDAAKLLWKEAQELYSKSNVNAGIEESTRRLALLA